MKTLILLISIISSVSLFSQPNNSCSTAIPYVEQAFPLGCVFIPPQNSISACYTFIAPGDSVDFEATSFPADGSVCDSIRYFLYDNSCNLLQINTNGSFSGLDSLSVYRICFFRECSIGTIGIICTNENYILPIELIEFSAISQINTIKIIWSTATETNCLGYVIQKSTNLDIWVDIGFVSSTGNTTQVIEYYFIDQSPTNGIGYYRLKQIDLDGQYEIFKVIAVQWNQEDGIFNVFRKYNFLGQLR